MVETISPVVYGGRTKTYWLALGLHALTATATAASFGALLGLAGDALGAPARTGWIALVACAGLYAARESLGLPIPIPQRRRQVPEWWRTFYSRPVAAALYGVGLGVGYFTFLTYGTFVVVTVGALVSGDAATGALVVGGFGAARAISLTFMGAESDATALLDDWGASRRPSLVNAAALLAVAGSAAVAL